MQVGEPAGADQHVVVQERDPVGAHRPPADVASGGRASASAASPDEALGEPAEGDAGQRIRVRSRPIVDQHHLER